jgi:adenylate kinase
MEVESNRRRPNVLITGTPGVGKTSTAALLAKRTGMKHVHVGDLIKQHKCYEGRDEELDAFILDEDKLLDLMEPVFQQAQRDGVGIVADYHMCDLFPERWFDLVLVLRAKTEILFDRLTERGYKGKKREENMESEIMQVVLEEARGAYELEIVHEVPSNTKEDMESNIDRVQQWIEQWIKDREREEEEEDDDDEEMSTD